MERQGSNPLQPRTDSNPLWDWPAACLGLWCEMMTAPWLLVPPPHHATKSEDEQLAVPQELEEDEHEHSLFA